MNFFITFFILYIILLSLAVAMKLHKSTIKLCGFIGNVSLFFLISKNDLLAISLSGYLIMLIILLLIIKTESPEYLLYQIATIGISSLITSNIIQMFLALEIINFVSITLIPIYTRKLVALESALKYFLISAISGAFFIFGGAFLYGEAVSLDLLTISTSGPNALGVILILIGLFIKLGVAPFHVWLPDAYEGANYKTFIFIALYTKLFILFVLFLFWKVFMIENFFLIISIILCGLIGGIQALFQEKIKRFMSFTLIFNNIFFLLPLWSTNIFYLIITFIFYFFNNLLTLSLFLKYSFRNIRDLLILDPLQKIILLISLFSSIGVPPLVGFFVKTLPFYSDINKSYFLLIFIIFFVILTSWYYLRLISVLFFSEVKNKQFLEAIPAKLSLFISALTVFLVLFLILFI